MKNIKSTLLLCAIFYAGITNAQRSSIIVSEHIVLPDTASRLVDDLNLFLEAADKSNLENAYIRKDQKVETYILLDEIMYIHKNPFTHQDHFYKPYLNNIIELEDQQYLLQISYIGGEAGEHELQAMFEIIAHESDKGFRFSSPLSQNKKRFQKYEDAGFCFYFKDHLNMSNVKEHIRYANEFDEKLGQTGKETIYYCCANFQESLQLIGVIYKKAYNGMKRNVLSSSAANKKLILMGNGNVSYDTFDGHDLWHDRLSLLISRRTINKPLDEGCAYLYAGSWGMSWKEIFTRFMDKVASDKSSDWRNYKENPVDFGESRATHLYVDYVVNALLVEKIENDHGFEGVMKLLKTGPSQAGNELYYNALQELTGISKESYNEEVWQLIRNQASKLSIP